MADRQQPMFEEIPDIAPAPPTTWVCGRCGNDNQRRIHVDVTRPAVDPRYAIGVCEDCCPTRKTAHGPRRDQVALVPTELFDRPRFLELQRQRADQKVLAKLARGELMTEAELARAQLLIKALK